MFGEEKEGSNIEEVDNPLEEDRVGPTSIDITDEQISIGSTSINVTDEQASIAETPLVEQQELQQQNNQIEQVREESKISNRKQKRKIISYLSDISKQVEKQGNQINRLIMVIQSLQKQKPKQIKSKTDDQLQLKTIKQIRTQIIQMQKQITRIQNDVQRIRSAPTSGTEVATRTRFRKSIYSVTPRVKLKSKKSKPLKSTKVKGSKRSKRST